MFREAEQLQSEEDVAAFLETNLLETVSKSETIKGVTLTGNDLQVYIDMSEVGPNPLTIETYAEGTASRVTDVILRLNALDKFWETLKIDFGSIGYVVKSKSGIKDNGMGGRFFSIDSGSVKPSENNFLLENTAECAEPTEQRDGYKTAEYHTILFEYNDLYDFSNSDNVVTIRFEQGKSFINIMSTDISDISDDLKSTMPFISMSNFLTEFEDDDSTDIQLLKKSDTIIVDSESKFAKFIIATDNRHISTSVVTFADKTKCYTIAHYNDISATDYTDEYMSFLESIRFTEPQLIYEWEQYYKNDDYSKYTAPASENGLDGTLLQVTGIAKLKSSTNGYFYMLSDNGNDWIFSSISHMGQLSIKDGDNVTIYGLYLGVAGAFDDLPFISLTRLKQEDDVFSPIIDEVPIGETYEGRSFEDIHAEMQN